MKSQEKWFVKWGYISDSHDDLPFDADQKKHRIQLLRFSYSTLKRCIFTQKVAQKFASKIIKRNFQ